MVRVLTAMLFIAFAASAATIDKASPCAVGKVVPSIRGADQYGRLVATDKLGGRWLLLNFITASAGYGQEMAKETQALADLLRVNGVSFTYVTALLEDANKHPSTSAAALDWAVANGITEPVLHLNGIDLKEAVLGRHYASFLQTAVLAGGDPNSTLPVPLVVLIDPSRRIRMVTATRVTPDQILAAMDRGDLTYSPSAPVPGFGLSGFNFGMTYQVPGSRMEPTDSLLFSGAMQMVVPDLRVASSAVSTPSRSTYRFTIYKEPSGSGGALGNDIPISLQFSGAAWNNGIVGKFRRGMATASLVDFEGQVSTAFIPVDADAAGTVTVGPFTLSDLGVAPTTEIRTVTVSVEWLRPSSLVYLHALAESIGGLDLTKGAKDSLLSPFPPRRWRWVAT